MSINKPKMAFAFTKFSIAISIIVISVFFLYTPSLLAEAGSISVAAGERIDTLNMNGTFRSVQSSEVENSSRTNNGFTNLSNFGSWHLALENGTIASFDAILNYSDKPPGKSYYIEGFKPSTEKYIQLGSRGTDIIKGIANVSSEDKVIESNIGLTIMIIDLNKTNLIFDDSNKLEIKSPISGSVDSLLDSRGDIIEMDSANVTPMRNPSSADDPNGTLQFGDATSQAGSNPDDDRTGSSNPQYAGDDGSGSADDDASGSADDDGSDLGYEEY
jgi:hypothetical protein